MVCYVSNLNVLLQNGVQEWAFTNVTMNLMFSKGVEFRDEHKMYKRFTELLMSEVIL